MKRSFCRLLLLAAILLHAINVNAQTGARYPLIPYPASLQAGSGGFKLTPRTIITTDAEYAPAVALLQQLMQQAFGAPLKMTAAQASAQVALLHDETITAAEGYHLTITPDKITLQAGTPAGMFRAVETLRQLLPPAVEKRSPALQQVLLPALEITDAPAFAWRGIHLDVARHFFSVQYLKKLMDLMALYKMNKLHLHLTDDQGWRIEIKQYPALTAQGAWRTFDKNDSSCMRIAKENPDMALDTMHIIHRNGKTLYGGFYTQEDIKDLVKYAAARYIDIIPEIDMPGHMMAAIHAFPYLSCEGGSHWGELFSTPICPCNESTYTFAENVFTEIMHLFPSEYIHLGADEVDRKTWEKSSACTALMQREGLKDAAELQSYFVKRMERFFQSKGRKLIGWDEILEGGISPTANVMYWRSWVPDAPIKAARNGNHVIMSPGNPLYFDNPPDANSLSNIYHFNVVPEKLNKAQGQFIIGAQANLWSEHVPSENRADYLYFPRMLALAERVWSQQPDFASFEQRLPAQYKRLEALHVHYRLPDLSGFTAQNVFVDQAVLDIKKPLPGLTLHYTTDGSLPTLTAPALDKPLVIKEPETIKLAAFTAGGNRGDIYTLHYAKEAYQPAVAAGDIKEGLHCSYYKKYFLNTRGMKGLQPDSQFVAPNLAVPAAINAPTFGLQYSGYIDVPETGVYSFYFLCDDGGVLTIGDKEIVNNDGQHAPIEKSGQVALEKGLHPFKLDFIEGGGGFSLRLKYGKGNGAAMPVPDSFYKH
ncbi:MAG TPA: family 20 glycosylhydrolase [Chitinophaga sp.]|uniref:family 20 glycosylhydrolase n=1 Tax=Chitinophaga sp. TaxID=1869181 RepID=UPI002DBB73D8|nr:family 20 glycosylhydrolase [Chitinophaga sp.]HEU4552103.1 family 20 glycosylhydrolase [Chitinophaga sp.]